MEKQLNPSKACGPDEMSPRLLKLVAHEIAPAFQFMFQQTYDLCSLPTQWKQGLVSAVYKKGSKADPANYHRPSM